MQRNDVRGNACGGLWKIVKSSATKNFIWGFVAKTFPWACVNDRNNTIYIFLRNGSKVKSFGEPETQLIVRALIRTTLPRRMRISKVNDTIELLLKLTELCKFCAIIQGDAFQTMLIQGFHHCKPNCFAVEIGQQYCNQKARLSINKG